MKNLNLLVQKYLIWAFPVVLITVIWSYFQTGLEVHAMNSMLITALREIMDWALILWFVCLFIFMTLLVFSKNTQEVTIRHLAGIKERDEREEIISGVAAKRSFITTTSILIFLLFLSCVMISVKKLPQPTSDGRKHSLALGFHFSMTDTPKISPDNDVAFEYGGIPLSKSAIILVALIWQVSSFRFRIRRELKDV